MSKKAFDKISEGLKEAIAVARGEAKPARLYVPAEIDVRAVRDKCAMSQDEFASAFGFTLTQIRDWEQGRSRPLGGVRAYLMIIDTDPAAVLRVIKQMAAAARAA